VSRSGPLISSVICSVISFSVISLLSLFSGSPLYLSSMSRCLSSLCICPESESESYVMTDGQSASLSWYKAPIRGLRPDFYYRRTVVGLLMWGTLSDERTGLSFTIAAGPCQRSHSQVRAPWDSRPYFTVSDLRLPFSSPPTTRRITVEVFDPASTRVPVSVRLSAAPQVRCLRLGKKTPSPRFLFPLLRFPTIWLLRNS
jgi:hypothetical protein